LLRGRKRFTTVFGRNGTARCCLCIYLKAALQCCVGTTMQIYEFPNPSDFNSLCNKLKIGTVIKSDLICAVVALRQQPRVFDGRSFKAVSMPSGDNDSASQEELCSMRSLVRVRNSCHCSSHFASVCLCVEVLPGVFSNHLHTSLKGYNLFV